MPKYVYLLLAYGPIQGLKLKGAQSTLATNSHFGRVYQGQLVVLIESISSYG